VRILLTGASGMVGGGVLRECLRAADVTEVVSIVRAPTGEADPKLTELVAPDPRAVRLDGAFDACFFCLGVSSAGITEEAYTKVTYELTLAIARELANGSPRPCFTYVSGAGTRGDENGGMWARVKGRTENALIALFGERAYMFRPGLIRPMHGARSKTTSYRMFYIAAWPLMPLLSAVGIATTTERIGCAMLALARHGDATKIVGTRDINRLAKS
jgi:uncharacterized protein YbjT (DUF2867 family)